jgi:DNA-binding winged helix-turn-helix (wHTH) protein/tetratricopeptide (TPR) repeat protein/TolB-like protein
VPTTARHRIGAYSIDLAAREIRHGESSVDVEAKVFDLIALLIENRDHALSKREINAALWGQRPVTDAALSQLLSKARRALGDDGESQHVIRTVHGRGLQWAAPVVLEEPVTPSASAPAMSRSPRAWWLAAAAALTALAAALLVPHIPPSAGGGAYARVAVLPIADHTGETDLAWTRSGLAALIASLLQEQGKIEVIGSQAVQAAVGTRREFDAAALTALGKSLGATHFITGELRRVGTLYELDVHLSVDGMDDRHDTLRATTPTPLAIDAVPRVQRWLELVPPTSSASDANIRNPFLAEAYARGLDASTHGDEASAKKYFQIVLEQDPGLLWPRLRLATSQAFTNEVEASIENAKRVSVAARERKDRELQILALRQLSGSAYVKGDLDAAAGYLDEALPLLSDRSEPLTLAGLHSTYGAVEIKRGHLAQARQHLEQALPLTREAGSRRNEAAVLVNLAIVDGEQGRMSERIARFHAAIDAAREGGAKDMEMRALSGLAGAEFDAGRALDAVPMLKQALALARELDDLHTSVHVGTNLARVLATFGRYAAAETFVRQAREIAERKDNKLWLAKVHWADGAIAEHRAAWSDAIAALAHAHALFATAKSNVDDTAVLADIARVATRGGDAVATLGAERSLAALVDAARADPERATLQPLVALQARYMRGERSEAIAALQALLDANAQRTDWTPRLDVLLQLGRWRLAQDDPRDALALLPMLAPWLEQQPDAIELQIAILRATGNAAGADAAQTRLDHLLASPDLTIEDALLHPPATPDAPPAAAK